MFKLAALAGAAVAIDLRSLVDLDSEIDSAVDTDSTWCDANIAITYGEDNSNGGGCSSGSGAMCMTCPELSVACADLINDEITPAITTLTDAIAAAATDLDTDLG